MKIISENRCFGGIQSVHTHASGATGTDMTFGLFLPPRPDGAPVLWFLSGLTCTHENAVTKAGLQAHAARAGIAIVYPDTSPRGDDVPDDAAFDMGQGAGFYVDATEGAWAANFAMESYVLRDLPATVFDAFGLDASRQAITGHSMGGHGALTLALRYPGRFRSVSAFAPICNPSRSDWGRTQLATYVGEAEPHDATCLLRDGAALPPALIDAGTDDQFYDKLGLPAFAGALAETRSDARLRLNRGYDHSYFTVSTIAADHIAFHAEHLV